MRDSFYGHWLDGEDGVPLLDKVSEMAAVLQSVLPAVFGSVLGVSMAMEEDCEPLASLEIQFNFALELDGSINVAYGGSTVRMGPAAVLFYAEELLADGSET